VFRIDLMNQRVATGAIMCVMACSVSCGDDDGVGPAFADPAAAVLESGEHPAVLAWSVLAREMVVKHRPVQQGAFRAFAYLTLAQFAAVEAAINAAGVTRASVRGAVAGASAPVLAYLFPSDAAQFEERVRAEEASLPSERAAAFRSGEALGRAIGAKAVARAQADEFGASWTGTVPTGRGMWFSSARPPAPPQLPDLGRMRPFYLVSGNQFRPGPPPAFDSPAFRESLGEVRRISDTRTPAQDSIAKYWAMATGTLIAGFWNTTISELIVREKLGERAAARSLALMYTAAMDGLIACADAKFTYWLLRPTQADTAIALAIGLPNFPAYPSNHACVSGTAAYVLAAIFPGERGRLEQMARDAGISRVYGGIHYRFDSDSGLGIARKVSETALGADRRGQVVTLLR
jgi:hypothetical protein